ncbi:MAG TPA: 4-(cytidine 5'-diphospho)-2-C-methyl-D-erythritol kinase [Candidatus Atribacteria bacterium]|nr:4-(cytidine 5'-diphospho)-2-C-methyl-D-erythritol kinase [Candidatus Atribacteria bacterium]
MNAIVINSYSKINLILNILNRREDGYHEIETIMQSVNLADKITITEKEDRIGIECNNPQVPVNNKSLAYRSAEKILKKYKIERGVKIKIDKNIPIAGGMAGGSANSAAILTGINKIFNLNLSNEDLREMGEELGMDVPFCLRNGTALALHRGEKILHLPPITPPLWIIVINPGFEISTQWAYNNINLRKTKNGRNNMEAMLIALKRGIPGEIAKNLFNSFEELIIKKYPEVGRIKDRLLNVGALGALMSGSGPTVFGIMQNKEEALKVYERLKQEYKLIWLVHTF